MKVYKDSLFKNTIEKINKHKSLLSRLLSIGLGNPNHTTYTLEESIAKYNPGISKDEIKAWVWYRKNKGIPMKAWKNFFVTESPKLLQDWLQNGIIFFDPSLQEYVPFPLFVFGNIYEKINKLIHNSERIIDLHGDQVYKIHIETLEANKPKQLSIQHPIEKERPVILAIASFTSEFTIDSLRSDTGIILRGQMTLREAFIFWLFDIDKTLIRKTNAFEIRTYYLRGKRKPNAISKMEWREIKKHTRDEGERLFKVFLHEALTITDQLRIDAHYNSIYNAMAPLQHQKVPIGFEISKKFMGLELQIRAAQREGIAFMELVGSGVVAYDVGVGKTITAIIETAAAILNGKCKRPLIAVPNATYKNWLKEMLGIGEGMQGILSGTNIKVNDWFNLGSDYANVNLSKKIPEGTITIVTYEGFTKLGFNKRTQDDHFEQLYKILMQLESTSERDKEKNYEKIRSVIGVGLKDTVADIEDLGIDYLVVDEAHNFKNIFFDVKGDQKNGKQFYIKGSTPSDRGIKAFFICNYIQRKFGRNVMLLTATPFTNSPVEIYSMLSLVAYQYMKSFGILNIRHFFEQYIHETTEYVVAVDGEIKLRPVVKSFNNRISLQKLINSHINFKTGEQANIPRPCKINLPKTKQLTEKGILPLPKEMQLLTYLKMTDKQETNQLIINADASLGADQNDPGNILRLLNQSLDNALSPYLISGTPKDFLDFVDSSPKIKYTLECIASVKKWYEKRLLPVSGQVIYINRGKHFFHYIKEYLEVVVGFKKGIPLKDNPRKKVDQVEIITGETSITKKEKIKKAFNEGTCKVIIGTSTIKEGINLQKRSTNLFNLYPDWNPTDIRQLEGRIWRQLNENAFVRCVMPLVENSMDVFVFQKYEEKAARIHHLWSSDASGNVVDQDSLDHNEIKFALITDIDVLLRFEQKQLASDLKSKILHLRGRITDLQKFEKLKNDYQTLKVTIVDYLHDSLSQLPSVIIHKTLQQVVYFSDVHKYSKEDLPKTAVEKWERIEKLQQELLQASREGNDDLIIKALNKFIKSIAFGNTPYYFENFKRTASRLAKFYKTHFQSRGFDKNTNVKTVIEIIEEELKLAETQHKDIYTEDFKDKLKEKIRQEKEKFQIKGGSFEDRVKDFEKLNHLMSYKFKDINHRECTIPSDENPELKEKVKRLRIAKAKAIAIRIKRNNAA